MKRSDYQAPKVLQVKLETKHAILAVCNSSPTSYVPKQPPLNNCHLETNCFNVT